MVEQTKTLPRLEEYGNSNVQIDFDEVKKQLNIVFKQGLAALKLARNDPGKEGPNYDEAIQKLENFDCT